MNASAPADAAVVARELFAAGHAIVPRVLDSRECAQLRAAYERDDVFRSRVVMERQRFGRGEYRYFAYPLPPLVERLRLAMYELLAPLANRWMEELRSSERFPLDLPAMLALCTRHEQTRPTPLLLKYSANDFNCLHQDLYGDVAFPLQVTIFLSAPDQDYTGGEFVLAEQRPRAQTRVDDDRAARPKQRAAAVVGQAPEAIGDERAVARRAIADAKAARSQKREIERAAGVPYRALLERPRFGRDDSARGQAQVRGRTPIPVAGNVGQIVCRRFELGARGPHRARHPLHSIHAAMLARIR